MNKVLTITLNPSVDISSEAEEVIPDVKSRCQAPIFDPGGGGINVSRVLSRLGVETEALFLAGGYTGDKLIQMLQEENIEYRVIQSSQVTRQNIAIIDNQTGRQYRFVFPGSVSGDTEWKAVLKFVEDYISSYDYVVGSGSLPKGVSLDFYSKVGKIARQHNKRFVLDTYGEALLQGIQEGAFFIKPNAEEFEELKELHQAESNEALLRKLFESGIEQVIQTFGKEKTMLFTPDSSHKFIPPEISPRSSIGAGDSFVGGMIAGLIKYQSMDQAVGYGISAAASTLQSEGTDLCDLQEVNTIFEANFAS